MLIILLREWEYSVKKCKREEDGCGILICFVPIRRYKVCMELGRSFRIEIGAPMWSYRKKYHVDLY